MRIQYSLVSDDSSSQVLPQDEQVRLETLSPISRRMTPLISRIGTGSTSLGMDWNPSSINEYPVKISEYARAISDRKSRVILIYS